MGGIIERHKELKRRRQRRKKVALITKRAAKANASEKQILIAKLRNMTPGAEIIIARLGLE